MKKDEGSKCANEEIGIDPHFRPHLSLAPYWFLVILRLVLTLIPQTGYVHPDEFFQSVEVINEDVFQVIASRSWEFNSTAPIRSVALSYLFFGTPLYLLKNVSPFLYLWFDLNCITTYTLLVLPRIVMFALSFVTDICLYKTCFLYGQNYRCRLITLASSFVTLVYGTRTFTNSIEMALASLLIYLVAESMARTDQIIYQDEYLRERYNNSDNIKDRIRFHRMRLALPWHSFASVFFIATITVAGTFNRPTFLIFAFPPIFFWLVRGLGSQVIGLADFNMRTSALVVCALPALFLFTTIDSVYYGALTINQIANRNVSVLRDVVFTPYNFVRYNANPNNLANHGIHWRFTHFLINVPLLYNVLGIVGLLTFVNLLNRAAMKQYSSLPRIQSIIGLMTASFIFPIAALSLFPHQEPRFLIPVTLPLVFLYTQRIRNVEDISLQSRKQNNGLKSFVKREATKFDAKDGLLALWYTINIVLTIFFGFVHQAGIVPLVSHLNVEMSHKSRLTVVHLVTSHLYPLPTSMLFLKYGKSHQFLDKSGSRYQKARDFFAYDCGSSVSMDFVASRMSSIIDQAETVWAEKRMRSRIYYAGPSSLVGDLQVAAFKHNLNATVDRIFYPHISTEAPPWDLQMNFGDPLKSLSNLAHNSGLALLLVTRLTLPQKQSLRPTLANPTTYELKSGRDYGSCPAQKNVHHSRCTARCPLLIYCES